MTPSPKPSVNPMLKDNLIEALIERVAGATGPDREIDIALWRALDGGENDYAVGRLPLPWLCTYTSSIDAALGLVERLLPGWEWLVSTSRERQAYWAEVHEVVPKGELRTVFGTRKPTAPLAIISALLATLRAIQSTKTGGA